MPLHRVEVVLPILRKPPTKSQLLKKMQKQGKVAPAHHLCHAQKLKQLNVYLHGKNRAKATVPLSWQIFIYGQLLGVAQIHLVPIHFI